MTVYRDVVIKFGSCERFHVSTSMSINSTILIFICNYCIINFYHYLITVGIMIIIINIIHIVILQSVLIDCNFCYQISVTCMVLWFNQEYDVTH